MSMMQIWRCIQYLHLHLQSAIVHCKRQFYTQALGTGQQIQPQQSRHRSSGIDILTNKYVSLHGAGAFVMVFHVQKNTYRSGAKY
jgi:hypothetical protein